MIWRSATREEVFSYYHEEFPDRLDELPSFVTPTGPKEFGIAFRDPYPIRDEDAPARDFIRRSTRISGNDEATRTVFPTRNDLMAFIQHPALNDPLGSHRAALADLDTVAEPEPFADGVYFSADHWDLPWLLFVDIDAKDVAQARANEEVDDSAAAPVETAGILDDEPARYPYAWKDIEMAIEYGFRTRSIFETIFDAEDTLVLYTGQGVHVYLLDTDPAHRYDAQSREVLNDILIDEFDIPIDPVVTADRRRLARLPYSLHADVCRVVQPIDSPDFDFRTEALPRFLTHVPTHSP